MVRTLAHSSLDVWPNKVTPILSPVAGHCSETGRIVINFPGYNGEMDGYSKKYVKLGEHVASSGLASYVRTQIPSRFDPYSEIAQSAVRTVIAFVLKHSEAISGVSSDRVKLYLVGTSAGGGAIASVAYEYPQVKKLLLINPAFSKDLVDPESAINGISMFSGDVAIVVGGGDSQGIKACANQLRYKALSANLVRLQVIPDADHNLSGEENGKLLSLLPNWAFASTDPVLPDPSGGIVLYGDPPGVA